MATPRSKPGSGLQLQLFRSGLRRERRLPARRMRRARSNAGKLPRAQCHRAGCPAAPCASCGSPEPARTASACRSNGCRGKKLIKDACRETCIHLARRASASCCAAFAATAHLRRDARGPTGAAHDGRRTRRSTSPRPSATDTTTKTSSCRRSPEIAREQTERRAARARRSRLSQHAQLFGDWLPLQRIIVIPGRDGRPTRGPLGKVNAREYAAFGRGRVGETLCKPVDFCLQRVCPV